MKHFHPKEFACPCCGKNEMNPVFLETLDALREEFKQPIMITSGFRCKNHNEKVKGVRNSQHLLGLACDISTKHLSPENLFRLIDLAFAFGLRGIGVYRDFLHLDARIKRVAFWRI